MAGGLIGAQIGFGQANELFWVIAVYTDGAAKQLRPSKAGICTFVGTIS